MDDNYIIVNIGGRNYYMEASRFKDLAHINGRLVNVSNSNIQLVSGFGDGTQYPYISCYAMSQCRYYGSYSSSYSMVNSPVKYERTNINTYGLPVILCVLLLMILLVRLLFKR